MQGLNRKRLVRLIKDMVDEHYVPNSHRGSELDVYRRVVLKVYPISQSTFYKIMAEAIEEDGFVGRGGNRVERQTRRQRKAEEESRQYRLEFGDEP